MNRINNNRLMVLFLIFLFSCTVDDVPSRNMNAEQFYFPDEADPLSRASSRLHPSRSQSSLSRDDDDAVSTTTDGSRRHTNELQDIIDFEQSVIGCIHSSTATEAVEALPLVNDELGVIGGPRQSAHVQENSDTDDEFCFIGDEERPKCGIDNVVHSEEPIRIVDNHFSIPLDKHDMLKAPPGFPQAVTRYTICDLSISMHLYGGNDFPSGDTDSVGRDKDRERATTIERAGMSDAYKKGVAFSKVSSTVTFPSGDSSSSYKPTSSGSSKPPRSWKERGGVNRNFDVCVEIHSNKGRFSYETYPAHTREASRQVLVLSDFEVWDRLSSSSFNKMFYTGRSERSKKSDQATMYVKCIFIRPEPTLPRQEANLYISFMPKVNINIDQDAIIFLADFFTQLNGGDDETVPKQAAPVHQPPVMIVEMPELQEMQARKMVDENLMLLIDEEEDQQRQPSEVTPPSQEEPDNNPVYFR